MNPVIRQYFDLIEARLIESSVIVSYQVLGKEITPSDGKLRIKAKASDGSVIELFEYVAEIDKSIHLLKYSYHWQDSQGNLIRRWDNAPHYRNLLNSTHHVHIGNDVIQEVTDVPDTFFVMSEIEEALK